MLYRKDAAALGPGVLEQMGGAGRRVRGQVFQEPTDCQHQTDGPEQRTRRGTVVTAQGYHRYRAGLGNLQWCWGLSMLFLGR
jgi:hypothetical protein